MDNNPISINPTPTFKKLNIKGKPYFEFMQVLYTSGFPEAIFNYEDLLVGNPDETDTL